MSWLLVVAGGFLLFLGARDWFESHTGQRDAEREFEQPVPASFPNNNVAGNKTGRGGLRPSPEPGDSIAKLTIPRLDTQLYVLEGIGSGELRRGPGHMTGTAFPGENGNCIIAGHRDTHFRVLQDIRKGDAIQVRTSSGNYVYRVDGINIVSRYNNAALRQTRDARLHLITCYPFHYLGNAPRRFVVEAKRIN